MDSGNRIFVQELPTLDEAALRRFSDDAALSVFVMPDGYEFGGLAHIALLHKRWDLLGAILQAGSGSVRDSLGRNSCHVACELGHRQAVEMHLRHIDLWHVLNSKGERPLVSGLVMPKSKKRWMLSAATERGVLIGVEEQAAVLDCRALEESVAGVDVDVLRVALRVVGLMYRLYEVMGVHHDVWKKSCRSDVGRVVSILAASGAEADAECIAAFSAVDDKDVCGKVVDCVSVEDEQSVRAVVESSRDRFLPARNREIFCRWIDERA